ncbi:CHASE2 domain-containing protein [Mesorhizobium sp. AaZ16]|uniref:CHASE2 domain-containing protein n=1 Tax=Mesorhizobium sp. AaZ16 TaxID=3402289 RepID=UPI00374EE602
MFSGGPWWKGLGASEPGSPRRNGVLAIALAAALLAAGLSFLTPWRLVEARAFDYLSTIAPPARPVDGPVVVAIDEPSLAEIGLQWPWPRDLHARLIEALRRAGAKAIGVDIIFAEPSIPAADEALAAALGPDVVLAGDETFIETEQAAQHVRVEPLAMFTATGAATGIASISPDGDGILRRVPGYRDGFAAQLAEAAGRPATVPDGALIQTFGPSRTYPTVSYYQALDPDNFLPENYFRDRVVMVGLSLQNAPTLSEAGADVHATPFTIRTGRLVAGVEIQATVFDNLAGRLSIGRAATATAMLSVVLGALAGALLVWRQTGWRTLAGFIIATAALLAGSYLLLRFGRVFVPPLAPVLATGLVASAQSARDFAAERRMRQGITRAFSQYLSPALVERLARDPSQLRLGGEVRALTILFCDIRGFTTIAEGMKGDPERLTTLINRLLTPLSEVVMAHSGTIDKYIGDCLMAFWNAPLDDPDHATHAVEAALGMMLALEDLNGELRAEAEARGETPISLRIGIGINTGHCVVGNVGSERRFDYSALGDAVNLASRLEGASKDLGVPLVIGQATAEQVSERIPLRKLKEITVKGRAEPVLVYAPTALD